MLDSGIKAQVLREFEDVAHDVGLLAHSYIVEEKRDYPRVTYRQVGRGKTGKVAGSPRDVVDTGRLEDSLRVNVVLTYPNPTVTYSWFTEYAEDIYLGVEQPPYPWVHLALLEAGID